MKITEFKDMLPRRFVFTCSECNSQQSANVSQIMADDVGFVYECENVNCRHRFSLDSFKKLFIDGKWKQTPPVKTIT